MHTGTWRRCLFMEGRSRSWITGQDMDADALRDAVVPAQPIEHLVALLQNENLGSATKKHAPLLACIHVRDARVTPMSTFIYIHQIVYRYIIL